MMGNTETRKGVDLLSAASSGRKGNDGPVRLVPIAWDDIKRVVRLIDQTLLPTELKYIEISAMDAMCEAIAKLRGARGAGHWDSGGIRSLPWGCRQELLF